MKQLAVSALVGLISISAWAGSLDPIMQRKNGDKPVSPATITPIQPILMNNETAQEPEEFEPEAPGALETLAAFDQAYQMATGEDTQSQNMFSQVADISGCQRETCKVWIDVAMNERPQHAYVYIDGKLTYTLIASSAGPGYATKKWDAHPNGPFYSGYYMSKKFPGASWHGLGDMPYAMFYYGGFAIHGTPSIGALGRPASHGCVRIDPTKAAVINPIVRAAGPANVWFSVQGARIQPTGAPLLLSQTGEQQQQQQVQQN